MAETTVGRTGSLAPGMPGLVRTVPRRRPAGVQSRRMAAARVRTIELASLLVLVAVVPYLNTLSAGFTFDDLPTIVNNPVVQNGIDVARALSTPLQPGDLYRPLTVLTFAVNQWLAPGQAWLFHAVNVAVHAVVTVLVFFLARVLTRSDRLASIAGALFAVHPVHTEAVTSLVGRAELLAAMFGVGALVAVANATVAAAPRRRRVLEWLGLGLFALALCSKESALTVAVLVPMVRVTARRQRLGRGLWSEATSLDWVPYALVAGVFVAARFRVVTALPAYDLQPLDNVLAFVPWHVRLATALAVIWEYFGLLLLPIVLSADYSYNQVAVVQAWWDPRLLGGLALLLAATVALRRSRRPALRFAVIFPFVALALTANVLLPIGTVKAERLLYLPSVGFVLLLALTAGDLARRPRYRRLVAAVLLLVIVGYAGRTWTRNEDWHDNTTLYRSMVRSAPDSAKGRYNYGVALQHENNDEAAVEQFERALSLYEWAEGAAFGIGLAFDRKNVPDRAAEWYRRALAILPGYDKAHNNLCRLHVSTRDYAAAERACRAGLRYFPANTNMLWGLGESFAGRGDATRALAVLERAQRLNPGDETVRQRLAEMAALRTQHPGTGPVPGP